MNLDYPEILVSLSPHSHDRLAPARRGLEVAGTLAGLPRPMQMFAEARATGTLRWKLALVAVSRAWRIARIESWRNLQHLDRVAVEALRQALWPPPVGVRRESGRSVARRLGISSTAWHETWAARLDRLVAEFETWDSTVDRHVKRRLG